MLPFLDRAPESKRLATALAGREGALVCLYGRRRLGKSRLLQHVLRGRTCAYYVGDDRDAPLQRSALAREIAPVVGGFADVSYPGWEELLARWYREAPAGAVLALDEFPAILRASPELPSLLQKLVDRGQGRHLVLCGSSQRVMHGLVLDASAPLYGRAREILRLEPLRPRWLRRAFRGLTPARAIEAFAVWGGVPRYWELAAGYRDLWSAVEELVLDPMGVLHREPERLLLDDISDPARAASILALIGQGSHRVSEIAGRLGHPATSLSRPLARLVDLGLVRRDVPFGASAKDNKRSLYRIGDPLLEFVCTFVEPNRTRLAAGRVTAVRREIEAAWLAYFGRRWEQIVRERVARAPVRGVEWGVAAPWWGGDREGRPLELDLVAREEGGGRALVGEAKLTVRAAEIPALLEALGAKARRCPGLTGLRAEPVLWVLHPPRGRRPSRVLGPEDVLAAD